MLGFFNVWVLPVVDEVKQDTVQTLICRECDLFGDCGGLSGGHSHSCYASPKCHESLPRNRSVCFFSYDMTLEDSI